MGRFDLPVIVPSSKNWSRVISFLCFQKIGVFLFGEVRVFHRPHPSPDTGMFRGEFVGLNGGADFYATSVDDLIEEGRKSLNLFLQLCAEKRFSGRFNVRLSPEIHAAAVRAAKAHNMSLNEWISTTLAGAV